MAPKKKSGKRSGPKWRRKGKKKQFDDQRDVRKTSRPNVENEAVNSRLSRPSPVSIRSPRPEAHKPGQALVPSSRDTSPWHDPFRSYLYPPTSLNFRHPFDTDGSHLSRRSPGLTEYEGSIVDIEGSIMAPGHEQHHSHQQRNHQPATSRLQSQSQQTPNRPRATSNGAPVNGEPQQQRSQNAKERESERDPPQRRNPGVSSSNGRMTNHIQVAKPYVFQQAIEGCLRDVGVAQAREDNIRLAGVRWIDDVRRALKL